MKYIFVIALLALTSCAGASLESSLGVDDSDNAIQCINADAHTANVFGSANLSTSRVEFPAWLRSANLEGATVEDLKTVFEAIATITENLNCP